VNDVKTVKMAPHDTTAIKIKFMKNIKRTWGLVCLLLCFSGCALFPTKNQPLLASHTKNYRILFDGRVIGQVLIETIQQGQLVRTQETTKIVTQFRGLKSITNIIHETYEENSSGTPLAIHEHIIIPNALRQISAQIDNGELVIRDQRGDQTSHLKYTLPPNFLVGQGLRHRMRDAALSTEPLVYNEWNFEQQAFTEIKLELRRENNPENSWRVFKKSFRNGRTSAEEYLVDDEFYPLLSHVNYLGKPLTIERCTTPCLDVKLQPLRPLEQQLIDSPYQITSSALNGHIRYQIRAVNIPPSTGEQQARKDGNSWIVDVCTTCSDKLPQTDNLARYLEANSWLEAKDKRLLKAAQQSVNAQDTPEIKMKKLTALTRRQLEQQLQFSGYASALQAYQNRAGDCTEYALLLAALGRSAGIPTRVLFGLSYSREQFHGHKHVFAPHAWVQAWVGDRWRSYDAALENYDAGHIALKISNGDQRDFNAIFENFGKLKIISAQQIVKSKKQD
jgi:hypothetical protein